MMRTTVGPVERIAIWTPANTAPAAADTLSERLRHAGLHPVITSPRNVGCFDDADLVLGIGDPTLAADHAIRIHRPLLHARSIAEAIDMVDELESFTLRTHPIVQMWFDRTRHRNVLVDVRIRTLNPRGLVTIEQRDNTTIGLAATVVTPDPLDIGSNYGRRTDRPIIVVDDAAGTSVTTISLDLCSTSTVRTARAGGHLHVTSDAGRHASLTTSLELGPTV